MSKFPTTLFVKIEKESYTEYFCADANAASLMGSKTKIATYQLVDISNAEGVAKFDTAFTPGPWTIEEYGDEEAPALVIHKESETRVCFMATPGSHGDPARIEADARLIAASPELYEALKGMVECFGGGDESDYYHKQRRIDAARDALAKATQP